MFFNFSTIYRTTFVLLVLFSVKSISNQQFNNKNNKCLNSLEQIHHHTANDIINAATENNPAKLNHLISNGMDINMKIKLNKNRVWTPLILSSVYGGENLVQALLKYRKLDLNYQDNDGNTALIWASNINYIPVVRLLINSYQTQFKFQIHGLNLSTYEDKITALHIAANNGYKDIVQILLNVDHVDINVKDRKLTTPFMYAIMHEHHNIVKTFLKRSDLKLNAQNRLGYTALMMSLELERLDIFKLLLSNKKIDINLTDIHGQTVLTKAIYQNKIYAIHKLLARKDLKLSAIDSQVVTNMLKETKDTLAVH